MIAAVVVYALGELVLGSSTYAIHVWADSGWTLISLVAALRCFASGRRSPRARHGKAFVALGLGCLSWFVGMLIWDYYELVARVITPFPTVADVGFFGIVPGYLAAFILYGTDAPSRHLTAKQLGELGVVLTTAALVSMMIYGGPALELHTLSSYFLASLGYPALHLAALIFGCLSLWQRSWGRHVRVLSIVLLSLFVLTLVTTLYGYSLLTHSYEAGHELDVLWVLTFALVIWAAHEEDRLEGEVVETGAPTGSTAVDIFVPAVSLLCVLASGYAFRASWTEDLGGSVVLVGVLLCLSIGLWSYGTVKLERDLRDAVAMKEQRLREAQKMEAVGTLAGGIAHDFNNLLTGMLAGAKLLRRKAEPGSQAEEYADLLLQSTLRAAELTDRLLNLARRREVDLRPVRPNDVVRRVAALLRSSLPETIRVVEKLGDPDLWVCADPGKLEQALLNLGINAGHAMPKGGLLEISVRAADEEPGERAWVVLSVRDTGVGIPEAIRDRIFEPFFSTRKAGEGTGLGLTMVYATVQEHGGSIDVETQVGRGTTFHLRLPRAAQPGVVDEATDAALELAPGWETILVVDDRDGPLLAAKMILEGLGYHVLIAWNARDGLRLVEEEGPIDLVLTDAVMPHMGGPALLAELRAAGYTMPVLLMSGYQETTEGHTEGFAGMLRKPFEPSALARAVRKALVESRRGLGAERGVAAREGAGSAERH